MRITRQRNDLLSAVPDPHIVNFSSLLCPGGNHNRKQGCGVLCGSKTPVDRWSYIVETFRRCIPNPNLIRLESGPLCYIDAKVYYSGTQHRREPAAYPSVRRK
jgi:hypothetical protein